MVVTAKSNATTISSREETIPRSRRRLRRRNELRGFDYPLPIGLD